jgi:hypothetical protein
MTRCTIYSSCKMIQANLLAFFLFAVVSATAHAQTSPYSKSRLVKEVKFDWSSHMRLATGSDNWPITWAGDDNQYVVWGDGGGFGGTNGIRRSSIGVARIENNWHDFTPTNVRGGYKGGNPHAVIGKSYGIVSIENTLYMWVGMFQTNVDQFNEVKLATSKDLGATWKFADWAFTREEGVMMPTVCNYGKDYEGAKDEFVYSYLIRFQSYDGPDDYADKVDWLNCRKPGLIDLARVPKDQIMNRDAYAFFSGLKNGKPVWTKDIEQRKPVFENPAGVGWCINVSFNSGLGRYMLTTEHTETHRGNMGIFDAPDPWGPWTTVLLRSKLGRRTYPPQYILLEFLKQMDECRWKDLYAALYGTERK